MTTYKGLKGTKIQNITSDAVASQYGGGAWASGTAMNQARTSTGGAGINTAALMAGGQQPGALAHSEEWNGSAWTEGDDLNTARREFAGCGTQTAGLGFAGYGSIESIASADEVVNAVAQQKPEFATPNQVKYIKNLCEEKNIDTSKYNFDDMTKQEAGGIIERIIQGDKK